MDLTQLANLGEFLGGTTVASSRSRSVQCVSVVRTDS